MSDQQETSREAFERKMSAFWLDMERDDNGQYVYHDTIVAWATWLVAVHWADTEEGIEHDTDVTDNTDNAVSGLL